MIFAILQARMSSTRLPGKVLKPILGKPMLQHQIERILQSEKIDNLIIATSDKCDDDPIYNLCKGIDIDCFRGSLENVLDRFYMAIEEYKPNSILRLTGDCPLIEPLFIDQLIDFFLTEKCDYASNCIDPTLPDGLDAEIFTSKALKKAWNEAVLPSELEHVTPYIRNHPELFNVKSWVNDEDLSSLRWTVDEPEDFEFVKKVYDFLYTETPDFNYKQILLLMDRHPELVLINQGFDRNEGLKK